MLREDTVFGPIKSRRLGRSLGINLLPTKGKICNFDCIYCECGWNRDGREDQKLPTAAEVRRALEDKLSDLMLQGEDIDNITFSGDGEPTINPEFPRIIEDTITLRDTYFPNAKISVLSNATRIGIPEVFEALRKVDNPILKIDAPTDELAKQINNPAPGYSIAQVIENLAKFEGDFILQTMMLKAKLPDGKVFRSEDFIPAWMDIVRFLKPRQTMVYTIDRPTPSGDIEAYTESEMRALCRPLLDEGFKINFYAKQQ